MTLRRPFHDDAAPAPNDQRDETMTEHVATDAAREHGARRPESLPRACVVTWKGEGTMAFEGRKAKGGPHDHRRQHGKAEPGPVDTLLIALAACTSEDVLTILEKRRTPATRVEIEVEGKRANAMPARLTARSPPIRGGWQRDRPRKHPARHRAGGHEVLLGTRFAGQVDRDRLVVSAEWSERLAWPSRTDTGQAVRAWARKASRDRYFSGVALAPHNGVALERRGTVCLGPGRRESRSAPLG